MVLIVALLIIVLVVVVVVVVVIVVVVDVTFVAFFSFHLFSVNLLQDMEIAIFMIILKSNSTQYIHIKLVRNLCQYV